MNESEEVRGSEAIAEMFVALTDVHTIHTKKVLLIVTTTQPLLLMSCAICRNKREPNHKDSISVD